MTKRRKVAFLLLYNLKEGAGNENWLISLLGQTNFPEIYDVSVYQPDIFINERFSSLFIKNKLKDVKIHEYHDYIHKIDFLNENKLMSVFLESFLRPVFVKFLSLTVYRRMSVEIGRSDVIYLFYNDYVGLIKGKPPLIIGTTHDWYPAWSNIFGKIRLKLISLGLLWHNINSFNFFTESSQLLFNTQRLKTDIIPVCRDSSLFYPVEQKENHKIVFTFLGRLVECKGLREVVTAWKNVCIHQESELHIIGKGLLFEELLEISDETIFVHGSVAQEELKSTLSKCDYFLFPTKCDTLGTVVMEAAMSGVYVYCSDVLKGEFDDLEQHEILEYIDPSADGVKTAIQEARKRGKRPFAKKLDAYLYMKANYDVSIMEQKLYNFIESNTTYNFSSSKYDYYTKNAR